MIFAVLCRFRQGASRKTAFCLWGPGKRAFSMVFLPNDSFSGLSFSVFSDALDISGNRNEVFGHRRCPNLLKMTKKVPFSAGTRRQDRFPSDFKPFFAVSAKAPAGKQRSACGDLDNVSFRRYFCLTVAYRGYFFPFSDAMDISGTRNNVFGHRRCPNLLKITQTIGF